MFDCVFFVGALISRPTASRDRESRIIINLIRQEFNCPRVC